MMKFIEKVKATNFGDNASYEVYKPSRTGQTPREMIQDWNAVIRGVDPDIELEDFETAMKEHDITFRRTSRIISQNGDTTHMIRIYFDTKDETHSAIMNGISILGRRYKVEPPKMQPRHIPCWKCGQYGHSRTNCVNNAICIRCGGKPGACSHPQNANIMYCATCKGKDHFTGQVRCGMYPKTETPQITDRPLPLPPQTAISPPRPSATDFPTLGQSVWKKNTSTETVDKETDVNEATNSATQEKDVTLTDIKAITNRLEESIERALGKCMQATISTMEQYVDHRISQTIDQVIKFTMTVVNNVTKPPQMETLQQTANNTSKKLWRKRVQMVLERSSIDILIEKMTNDLRQELRQELNTITAHTFTNMFHPPAQNTAFKAFIILLADLARR